MVLHTRFYKTDEELGKRDDDFRPKRNMTANPLQWRKRRFLLIIVFIIFAYFFVKNIPSDLGSADSRLKAGFRPNKRPLEDKVEPPKQVETSKPTEVPVLKPTDDSTTSSISKTSTTILNNNEPTGAPPKTGSAESEVLLQRYYDGPIKFYRLLSSLNRALTTQSVLFAASSFKSLANLLPLACDMAKRENNRVHVAIMSRDTLSLDELKEINNIDADECRVNFHDARADYSEYSTDIRHEGSVSGGLAHIHNAIKPHAIIVDDENVEDSSFSKAIRMRAKSLFTTLIEIPQGQYESYKYMCRLDYKSLQHWHAPTVEIVVHARKSSAGGLIKLLRTLAAADYKHLRMPKITVDLATTIAPALQTFLSNFKWPPRYEPATKDVDPITLRHHVQTQRVSTEQAALRFVESFYPASFDNHILIVSPQVELSPQFYRYLHYAILEYKYATPKHSKFGDLLGISLDVPTSELSGKREFIAPEVDGVGREELKTSFLYQAPSGSSLLIFGDKWSTFHDYLTHRVAATRSGIAKKTEKIISETEPSWMEYLLELMRARAWVVLYPAKTFATVHNELAQIPEEFTKAEKGELLPPEPQPPSTEEPFLLAPNTPVQRIHTEEETSNPATPLHEVLPLDGKLPGFSNLPFMTYDAELKDLDSLGLSRAEYLTSFRRDIGGCNEEDHRPRLIQDGKTDDLFCLPGVDILFDTQAEAAIADADVPKPIVE